MSTLHHMGLGALVLVVGVGLVPGFGDAAMVKLSLPQLTSQADVIVRGTVTSQASAWNAQRTAIYTDVTVAVEEAVKGSPAATVTFRIAGGVVGDVGMRTSNDPVFQDGEQVIVFLSTQGAAGAVVGLRQGKYTVRGGTVNGDGQTMPVADFIAAIRAASR